MLVSDGKVEEHFGGALELMLTGESQNQKCGKSSESSELYTSKSYYHGQVLSGKVLERKAGQNNRYFATQFVLLLVYI